MTLHPAAPPPGSGGAPARVRWSSSVEAYLSAALGAQRLAALSRALATPSLAPCLRVNTLRAQPQDVAQRLRTMLQANLARPPYVHPAVPCAVVLPGSGPHRIDLDLELGAVGVGPPKAVLVNRYAAEAVLKGAHVYCPGLLAASPGIAAGDRVVVSAALELPGRRNSGIPRGALLAADSSVVGAPLGPGLQQPEPSSRLLLGIGTAATGRRAMFRAQRGLAVAMERRLYEVPPCNGLLRGEVMLQALPSILTAQVLAPEPGWRVLDMCASPGGKTTALAQLMGDRGQVVALDRTHAKVAQIESLAADFGLTCIEAYKADATQAVAAPGAGTCAAPVAAGKGLHAQAAAAASEEQGEALLCTGDDTGDEGGLRQKAPAPRRSSGLLGAPPYPPASFHAILLDPPCSALGLRPRLLHEWTLPQLRSMATYQRALLHTAVALLRPGGLLLYCTCTINPDENEANVAWALDKFGLELLPSEPYLGLPGLVGADPGTGSRWLTPSEALLVQRFEPGVANADLGGQQAASRLQRAMQGGTAEAHDDDVMGFFIALMRKPTKHGQ